MSYVFSGHSILNRTISHMKADDYLTQLDDLSSYICIFLLLKIESNTTQIE